MLARILPHKFCAVFNPRAREEKDKSTSKNSEREKRTESDEEEQANEISAMKLQEDLHKLVRGLKQLEKQQELKINDVCSKLDRVEIRMIEVQKDLQENGTLKIEADMDANVPGGIGEKINEVALKLDQLSLKEKKVVKLMQKVEMIDDWLNTIQKTVNSSRDGMLIWKVENVSKLILESQTTDNFALFSDYIYTSQYGYKLQAVIYLNGIASGRGTHLSVYITIHKGEYDAILSWPFQKSLFFTLLDQNDSIDERMDKMEELVCNRKSPSFMRPESEVNPGWGFPKFITLHKLMTETFVKDDCFFLKIEVDSPEID
ncbi:TNF receptor-associated factor 1-like [Rhopilema esculentum]|uniref:TNF receptor-associated factor 1-like n=1 Tax=Rhopilema esculentum TaxID=499914 RepID=UPI0031D931C1